MYVVSHFFFKPLSYLIKLRKPGVSTYLKIFKLFLIYCMRYLASFVSQTLLILHLKLFLAEKGQFLMMIFIYFTCFIKRFDLILFRVL